MPFIVGWYLHSFHVTGDMQPKRRCYGPPPLPMPQGHSLATWTASSIDPVGCQALTIQ